MYMYAIHIQLIHCRRKPKQTHTHTFHKTILPNTIYLGDLYTSPWPSHQNSTFSRRTCNINTTTILHHQWRQLDNTKIFVKYYVVVSTCMHLRQIHWQRKWTNHVSLAVLKKGCQFNSLNWHFDKYKNSYSSNLICYIIRESLRYHEL